MLVNANKLPQPTDALKRGQERMENHLGGGKFVSLGEKEHNNARC